MDLFSPSSPILLSSNPNPHIVSLSRFLTVKNILHPNQSLSLLSVEFESGALGSLSVGEITKLICSLFMESVHRNKFLQLLQKTTNQNQTNT
jgi:hypothetical protein